MPKLLLTKNPLNDLILSFGVINELYQVYLKPVLWKKKKVDNKLKASAIHFML